jgi:hypothetical protein
MVSVGNVSDTERPILSATKRQSKNKTDLDVFFDV